MAAIGHGAKRLRRRLGGRAYRLVSEKLDMGFPIRSNPELMGPTPEFPGVDIDAVHRNPRWKKIKEAA